MDWNIKWVRSTWPLYRKIYPLPKHLTKQIPSAATRSLPIYEDRDGVLWVGTFDMAWTALNPKQALLYVTTQSWRPSKPEWQFHNARSTRIRKKSVDCNWGSGLTSTIRNPIHSSTIQKKTACQTTSLWHVEDNLDDSGSVQTMVSPLQPEKEPSVTTRQATAAKEWIHMGAMPKAWWRIISRN